MSKNCAVHVTSRFFYWPPYQYSALHPTIWISMLSETHKALTYSIPQTNYSVINKNLNLIRKYLPCKYITLWVGTKTCQPYWTAVNIRVYSHSYSAHLPKSKPWGRFIIDGNASRRAIFYLGMTSSVRTIQKLRILSYIAEVSMVIQVMLYHSHHAQPASHLN